MASTKSKEVIQPTQPKKRFPWKKAFLIGSVVLIALIISVALFVFSRINSNVSKTFEGNAIDALVSTEPLQKDKDGITNMLIFGNSSDDPGHSGALLADSIMIVSINHTKNTSHTLSVPRDLWIEYGRACGNGAVGKINAYYQCVFKDVKDKKQASRAFADMIGSIFGVPIQYYAEVNYTFVKDAVNAMDGVDVVIKSDDPRGILDRNFDRKCPNGPYTCYNVKYENGPAHLDGEHALYLAQARNAQGGYGLPQSNFDREVNQQLILQAMQEKALSLGVLSNPAKVISLADSLGNNITTNIPANQLRSAADSLKKLGSKNMHSIRLNDPNNPLVTTGSLNGQSIVLPTAGLYSYDQLRSEVAKALTL